MREMQMPQVAFESLPDDARLWVFASSDSLDDAQRDRLLASVDQFLSHWSAHGAPLSCARDWRDARFLAVGVDQRSAGASGCSIDGMFRTLRTLESALGASLTAGGRVYWRDASGEARAGSRDEFSRLSAEGAIDGETRVFDTAITTAGEWRNGFERAARDSWHGTLLETSVEH
jgi:hypothetical protein